jgi:hypothetical protein
MDGNWALETLGEFSRLYSQVYVVHALNVNHEQPVEQKVQQVFQSYPWRGGFSRLNFYRSVRNSVPPTQRPAIQSIRFASPGTMVLNLVPSVAELITVSADRLLDENGRAHMIYKSIDKEMAELGLKKAHVRGHDEDAEGEIAIRNLTNTQLAFVQEAFSDLARAVEFKGADRLSELTGNRLAALKMMMSYFRRIGDLAGLSRRDLIRL